MNDAGPGKDVERYIQVDAESHYNPASYLNPQRLASIGYQVQYLNRYFPKSKVLEVGVGTGLGAKFFKELGCEVSTLDVDSKLSPTVLGSVTEIPLADNAYESFVCCQVLEHLPWEEARKALRELHRVAVKGGIISVPAVSACLSIRFFPFRRNPRSLTFPLPGLGSRKLHVPGEHHWELGRGVSLRQFLKELAEVGFVVKEQHRVVENPFHHFLVLDRRVD